MKLNFFSFSNILDVKEEDDDDEEDEEDDETSGERAYDHWRTVVVCCKWIFVVERISINSINGLLFNGR